jgi:cytoskeletal protein CcmA (bactofilin family)
MFSNKSKENVPPAPPATAAATPMKRAAGKSSAPSIISSDLTVQGSLSSSGDVQIDGRVEGDIHSAGLVIGEKAHIEGEVFAEDVTVRGHVQGSIRARKVLLCSTCHVEGNILHEAFAVEAGAFFEGNCRHSDDPLAEGRGPAGQERKPTASSASYAPPSTAAQGADTVQPRPVFAAAPAVKAV